MSEPDPYRSLYPNQPHIQRLDGVAGERVSAVNRENALGGNIEQAVYSTAPYKGRDKTLCMAKGDTCEGRRAKGTEFCIGHLRSFGKLTADPHTPARPKDPT